MIVPALSAASEEVRKAAAEGIGELGDGSAIPALVESYLHGVHDLVFREAIYAVAKIGGEQAHSAIVSILRDDRQFRNLRWPAAEALGMARDAEAIPDLVAVLETDPEDVVREHAARALGEIADFRAVSGLRQGLRDSATSVRAAAAIALGELADGDVISDLLATMRDGHPFVREAASKALLKLDVQSLVGELRERIGDPDPAWRGPAARLIAEAVGTDALPVIATLVEDASAEVRTGVAHALAAIPGEAAAEQLKRLLRDDSEDVRHTALIGLERSRYRRAIPRVCRRARSPVIAWLDAVSP